MSDEKYIVHATGAFKKHYRLMKRRGKDMEKLKAAVALLASGESLPAKHLDHALSGKYAAHRECHIENDWLLVYRYANGRLILELIDTGTHSDLF